jgi:hypothetical protein
MRTLIASSLFFLCLALACLWFALAHHYTDAGFVVNLFAEFAAGLALLLAVILALIALFIHWRRKTKS